MEVISMSDSVFPSPRADYRARADLAKPSVEVVQHSPRIAVVALAGEHDVSTKGNLLDALASASVRHHVIVDLSLCTFADSSVVSALLALDSVGVSSVTLVVPETQRAVRRTFELVSMDEFVPVYDSLEEALAAAGDDDSVEQLSPEAAS
jgi:anti-sigma B factor antagonist